MRRWTGRRHRSVLAGRSAPGRAGRRARRRRPRCSSCTTRPRSPSTTAAAFVLRGLRPRRRHHRDGDGPPSATARPRAATLEAPRQGEWISPRDHFPRALTPEYERLLCAAMPEGERIPFAQYGMPVEHPRGAVPSTATSTWRPKPLLRRVAATPSPPMKPLLWTAARLAPAVPATHEGAPAAPAPSGLWLGDAERWYAHGAREWAATASAALQARGPRGDGRRRAVEHLRRCSTLADAGYRRHFPRTVRTSSRTGLLVAWCLDHGVPSDVVLPVLRGHSPAPLGQGPARRAAAAVARSGQGPGSSRSCRRSPAPSSMRSSPSSGPAS